MDGKDLLTSLFTKVLTFNLAVYKSLKTKRSICRKINHGLWKPLIARCATSWIGNIMTVGNVPLTNSNWVSLCRTRQQAQTYIVQCGQETNYEAKSVIMFAPGPFNLNERNQLCYNMSLMNVCENCINTEFLCSIKSFILLIRILKLPFCESFLCC